MVTSASRLATALTPESPTVRIKRIKGLIEERQEEIRQTLGGKGPLFLMLGMAKS